MHLYIQGVLNTRFHGLGPGTSFVSSIFEDEMSTHNYPRQGEAPPARKESMKSQEGC